MAALNWINDWNSNRDCSFPWLPVVLAPWQAQERVDQERERVGNGGFKPACTEAALCTVYAEWYAGQATGMLGGLLHGSTAVWSPSDFSKSSHRPCRNGSNFFNSESQLKISFFRSPLGTVP